MDYVVAMKKFHATSSFVQVNGETIRSFLDGVPYPEEQVLKILANHGIVHPQKGLWYSQQAWLDAFKEFTLKPSILLLIGVAIPQNANFPPLTDMRHAFESIDRAYVQNHRGGAIGYYKLISFDLKKRIIQIEANTPYPEDFDEGIMIGIWERFRPDKKASLNVERGKTDAGIVFFTLSW